MKLAKDIYLVGSGETGVHLTDAYDCHVYLIDGGDELALIDAGAGRDAAQILRQVEQAGFSLDKLKYLLLTHAHADHAGGAAEIAGKTGVEVIASAVAADYLERGDEKAINLDAGKRAGFYPADYRFEACKVTRRVKEGDEIRVGRYKVAVLETPGHCAGHVSYRVEIDNKQVLFGGDLVFFGGKVAIQFIDDCDVFAMGNSLMKLAGAEIDLLLPGHELFVLKDGQKHIQKGIAALNRLALPESIIQ
jgi:hydroxyacylglutathione hydrolase